MVAPTPAGALPAAFRVHCIRCVRRLVCFTDHKCLYKSSSSLKCSFCIEQNGSCIPLPWFTRNEYDDLVSALANNNNDEIIKAAKEIERILRLATANLPRDTEGFLLGILEETRALRNDLVEVMRDQKREIQRLATAAEALVSFVEAGTERLRERTVETATTGANTEGPKRKRARTILVTPHTQNNPHDDGDECVVRNPEGEAVWVTEKAGARRRRAVTEEIVVEEAAAEETAATNAIREVELEFCLTMHS